MIEFKKFEARTKSGMNLSKYVDSLASIEYSTGAYKTEANDLNAENKEKFQKALDKYKSAADAWEIYRAGKIHGVPETFYKYNQKYCPSTRYYTAGGMDNFDACISEIWGEASSILSDMTEIKEEVQKNKSKATTKK